MQVGYLADDLLDLPGPNGRLDADLDGVVDVALPFDVVVVPRGDGQPISYTISYTNAGTATAAAVQVTLTGYGAVDFGGSSSTSVAIGDVAPGSGGTIVVPAVLDASQDAESGELVAAVSDAAHVTYDWFWAQHALDAVPPTGLTIESPAAYAVPLTQTLYGLVAVDLQAPVLALDTAVDVALADGFLSAGERLISGGLTDNREVRSVALCLQTGDDLTCSYTLGQGTPPTNRVWSIDISALAEGDGVWQTMALSGKDGAGNPSNPISRTCRIDTIGPQITVTQRLTEVNTAGLVFAGRVPAVRRRGRRAGQTAPVLTPGRGRLPEKPDRYRLRSEISDPCFKGIMRGPARIGLVINRCQTSDR